MGWQELQTGVDLVAVAEHLLVESKVIDSIRRMILALVLAAMTLFGCSNSARFTMVSTDMVDLAKVDTARQYQNPPKIEAVVYRHWMFIFPMGRKPTVEQAVNALLKQANGDVAVDVVIEDYGWHIPFFFFPMIYGRSGWKIEGRVLNSHMNYPTTQPPAR